MTALHDPEAFNPFFALLHARSKDSPAKLWWHSADMHDGIFRALRMDRKEFGAIYAAIPFRLAKIEDRHVILAALPCPRIFPPHDDDDWLGIETVLAWDPVSDTAEVLGESGPQLVGHAPGHGETIIYSSPFTFLRAYAEARAQWLTSFYAIADSQWKKRPAEPDLTPGLLLLGKPDEVRWPIHTLPETVQCEGLDAQAVNRAMLRQAHIPRAYAAPSQFRRAA